MQIHSLELEDFCEDNYTFICILSALEDFKLAYLLNNNLNTQFSLASYSLDFEKKDNKASFSIFEYINEKYEHEWYLIANSYKEERINASDTLALSTETITYLIPEKKRVDYFLKIVGEPNPLLIQRTMDRINELDQVVTSYTIETDTLRSKEFLIF